MQSLGKLTRIDPRSVWKHEAHDFTPWLLENADGLADVLGIDLELTVNEHPVGAYSLDLLGKDLTNDCVLIVENQLAGTDHSHLGQLLTTRQARMPRPSSGSPPASARNTGRHWTG